MRWRLILMISVLIPLVGCGKTLHWKQEVLLQDGRVIVVDRVSKQTGYLFPENTIKEYQQTLSFVNPDNKDKIVWKVPEGLMPRMLDFDNGKPYLVFRTGSVNDYNTWGCPNPPHVIFRYEENQWKQIVLDSLPDRFMVPNMMDAAHSSDKFSEDGLVTVDEMHAFLKASQFPERRVISREKVHPIAEGCHPETLVRQGRESEINVEYRK